MLCSENLEVEYKWLLVFDPANSQLPVPSDDAKPLPAHLARKSRITAEASPKIDEPFGDPQSKFIWSEFNTCKTVKNPDQVKIDLLKPKQIWFYLGRTSTEARAQYTADLRVQINNPEGNFLESIRAASAPIAIQKQGRSYPVPYPRSFNTYNANASCAKAYIQPAKAPAKKPFRAPIAKEKPYHGKYAIKDPVPYIYKPKISCNVDSEALQSQRSFQQSALHSPQQSFSSPKYRAPSTQMSPVAPQAPMMSTTMQYSPTPPFNSPEDVKQVSRLLFTYLWCILTFE